MDAQPTITDRLNHLLQESLKAGCLTPPPPGYLWVITDIESSRALQVRSYREVRKLWPSLPRQMPATPHAVVAIWLDQPELGTREHVALLPLSPDAAPLERVAVDRRSAPQRLLDWVRRIGWVGR